MARTESSQTQAPEPSRKIRDTERIKKAEKGKGAKAEVRKGEVIFEGRIATS